MICFNCGKEAGASGVSAFPNWGFRVFDCNFYATCGEVLVNREGAKDAKRS